MPPAGTRAPPADEAALLARLRSGDRAAFTALVRAHGGAMLRLARSLARGAGAAEEVVQDAWLAALDGVAHFEGRSALRTWLLGIVANKARTRASRDGRSVPFSALLDPGGDAPSVDPSCFLPDGHWRESPASWAVADPERLALGTETRAAIEAAIASLPDGQRAVITLRDVEGLEAEEACNVLGVSETNQRVLLHRARASVRAALGPYLSGARPC
jgi:RNA polymerase sigma-70 factor (ECF subfamily)